MLVLTRKIRQTIVIDEKITITILKKANGGVQVGVDAPRHLIIRRGELLPLAAAERIDGELAAA